MRFQFTPMVKNLLIINVAIFALSFLFPIANSILSLKDFSSEHFFPTQLITCMFVHFGPMHLFGNMLSLYMFGTVLESYWGAKRFLLFYVVCGVGASLIYAGVHHYEIEKLKTIYYSYSEAPSYNDLSAFEKQYGHTLFTTEAKEMVEENPTSPQLVTEVKSAMEAYISTMIEGPMGGASGAVFGILMAFAVLFPNTELMMLFIPFPIKAKYFIIIYAFMELSLGVIKLPGDNIAHFAHLGGALFGFILVKYWQKQRNTFY
ncbi:MAG TPA: rhomboid family intramembrane serine protease [Cytophagaceae bacterium]|jgi:membrane associated rhomboid family serine protease|nr:rhomboid family intramembrane serine protease [Cytophagaceae bacterium]